MILCQFHRIDVISKFYLGCEPLEGRALFILVSPVGVGGREFLNHSMESSLSREGILCVVGCVAASLPSTHWMPVAPLPQVVPIKNVFRASLVAQWLRICLLMQGTRVRALAWEDPTCRRAAGPVSHNC